MIHRPLAALARDTESAETNLVIECSSPWIVLNKNVRLAKPNSSCPRVGLRALRVSNQRSAWAVNHLQAVQHQTQNDRVDPSVGSVVALIGKITFAQNGESLADEDLRRQDGIIGT